MADSSTAPPGSRAIRIPLHGGNGLAFCTSSRRRPSVRRLNNAETAEASDAGPSSLGSASDQDSTWSYSPLPTRPQDRLPTFASPPSSTMMQDLRFTGDSTASTRDDSSSRSQRKDKHKADVSPPTSLPMLFDKPSSPLGPSMISSSSYKSINLNAHHDDPDEPPRLITYTKSSQGFTWNDELFLPSYMLGRYGERGRKKQYDADFGDEDHCPVAEIFITDEEAEAMIP